MVLNSSTAGAFVAGAFTALAVGYLIRKRSRQNQRESTQCICGASMHGFSENERAVHLASARHRRNLRLLQRCAKCVVAENWGEYRNAISLCVSATDTVLEVGCGNGVTTSLISQTAARAIGVDMSAALIDEARERFPSLEWHAMDARLAQNVSKLARFDVIFIDLNGSRELETLLPLIDSYEAVMRPSLMVVKSNKLKRLILKCSSVEDMIREAAGGQSGEEPQTTPCRRYKGGIRRERRPNRQ